MNSFKQILEYIKNDFEIEEKTQEEINIDFIKNFHKEFNTYHEKINDNLDFLDDERFASKTKVSLWFKNNRTHPNFVRCRNNLYTLICISQDVMGSELLKGLGDFNYNNINEYMNDILNNTGGNNPLAEMIQNSPLKDMLNNPEIKDKIEKFMNKLKDINVEELLEKFQAGNIDISDITNIIRDLGLGNDTGIGNIMNVLGPLLGGLHDENQGLSPQQRARLRRERKKAEYRRKIRAREKAKKKDGNRKRKNK